MRERHHCPQFCNFPRRRWRFGETYSCYTIPTCYGPRRICRWKCFWYRETYYVRGCCAGYRGQKCDQPICSPNCRNSGVCVGNQKCDCPPAYGGSLCQLKQCQSDDQDCYPGYCDPDTTKCVCSSGFAGDNCQIMQAPPNYQGPCEGKLLDDEGKVLAKADCRQKNPNDTLVIYTNKNTFKQIRVQFELASEKIDYLPPYTDIGYVRRFNPGMTRSQVDIQLRDTVGANITLPNSVRQCETSANSSYGVEAIRCDITYNWTRGITHKQQLEMVLSGSTGGSKEIRLLDGSNQYTTRLISGQEESFSIILDFDLEPPVHCSEDNSCDNNAYLPLSALEDRTKSPDVTIQFPGWDDPDSRVYNYKYTVHTMGLDPDGNLTESVNPTTSGEYTAFADFSLQNANFTLPKPGLYSIVGEVMDFANNTRYTRGFVLYAGADNKIEPLDKPWDVSRSVNRVGKSYWMNDSNTALTISWKDCYGNNFISNNNLLSSIRPLPYPDVVDYTLGNISTSGTTNLKGITKFSYATTNGIQKDSEGRRKRQTNGPDNWIDINTLNDQISMTRSRSGGDGFQVWIKAEDSVGNELVDYINIRTDITAPDVSGGEFRPNVDRPNVDGFFSVVDILVIDKESDIQKIDSKLFDITDPKNPRLIGSATQAGQMSDTDPTECSRSNECECTNQEECYLRPQSIYVDNCLFLKYMNVPVQFEAQVYNRALLNTKLSQEIQTVDTLRGINEYPKPKAFRLVKAFPYSVQVTWYPPVACYPVFQYRLELLNSDGPISSLSASTIETEITDLYPNTEYTAEIQVIYENREESEKLAITFRTGPPPPGSGGLTTGAIVGIVIALLLVVAIVVIVILIVIRIRQKKTPLPRRLESVRVDLRKRITQHFGHREDPPPPYSMGGMTMNVAYASGPKLRDFDEDIYAYGGMETDPGADWKHSDDEVRLGRTIATGRFATIKEGVLKDRNGSKKVAVKMLKDYSEEDVLLMKAKMNFMATAVPNHNNIVNFVGAITEGPILLLEFCDQPLKEWLKALGKLSVEDEDDMTNFCTDIARGMQHLHENDIIHRRLGARNILLRDLPLMGRMVAKVTGFGPMKGEQKGDNVESDKERIPIKWMAIEQIGLANKKKQRPYNVQTDVWSYGITVWEIYSKGAQPYPDKRLGDIKSLLESGERPVCPPDCNDDMYDQVMLPCWHKSPSKRPTFAKVRSTLESLFHGAPDGDDYYGTDTDFNPELYDETLPQRRA